MPALAARRSRIDLASSNHRLHDLRCSCPGRRAARSILPVTRSICDDTAERVVAVGRLTASSHAPCGSPRAPARDPPLGARPAAATWPPIDRRRPRREYVARSRRPAPGVPDAAAPRVSRCRRVPAPARGSCGSGRCAMPSRSKLPASSSPPLASTSVAVHRSRPPCSRSLADPIESSRRKTGASGNALDRHVFAVRDHHRRVGAAVARCRIASPSAAPGAASWSSCRAS